MAPVAQRTLGSSGHTGESYDCDRERNDAPTHSSRPFEKHEPVTTCIVGLGYESLNQERPGTHNCRYEFTLRTEHTHRTTPRWAALGAPDRHVWRSRQRAWLGEDRGLQDQSGQLERTSPVAIT
jgi:hypothetical protein